MKYTVVFVFNKQHDKVLLQKKDKTEFKGSWNGVGGKKEPNETLIRCAIRETFEETGIDVEDTIKHIINISGNIDCDESRIGGETTVAFYYASIDENSSDFEIKSEREELKWFCVKSILNQNVIRNEFPKFAGDGDLQYAINLALKMYKNDAYQNLRKFDV